MRITILLILVTLKTNAATETYICYGKEETYRCLRYSGNDPNVYEYTKQHSSGGVTVHEFNDAGTRNPYAPADEDERIAIDSNAETPVTQAFIPYSPLFLFPAFELKR